MHVNIRGSLAWGLAGLLALTPAALYAQDAEKQEKQDPPAKQGGAEKSVEDLRKEALALNNSRSEDSMRKKIKELTEDRAHAKRLVRAAHPMLKAEGQEEQPFNYSAAHILGMVALDARETKLAIDFLHVAIDKAERVKSEGKVTNNRMVLVEAFLADNKPAEAEKIAEKMITRPRNMEDEEDPNRMFGVMFYARNVLVRTAMMQGNFKKAQEHLDFFEKNFPKGEGLTPAGKGMIQRTKAYFLQYKGDLKESIKVYEELAEGAENDEEKMRYQEQIGNLYADLGEVDKAYEIMHPLLQKNPDNPGLNNDLGYILAVHNRKLDEAEKMIRKAVEKEPENSSYLDSLAWVLYKQKKYQEAKESMLKAVAQERGRNTELMEHLGDIQLALGEKEEAKRSYEKALAAVTPSYKDQQRKPEIEKKLKELSK